MIRTALTVLVILCALALSSAVVHAETEEICGFEGPDIKYELELTDFVVRGPKPTEVGDDVVVEFNLRYVGDDSITFNSVFVAAKLPDGSEKRFIESHQGKTLNPGDSVSVRGEIELSMEGKWIIWPSFIYYHNGDVFGPIDPWHECVIVVKSQAPPEPTPSKPDLFLDNIWFNYTMRTIFFRIWNIGDADSGEFNVTLYIEGEVVETKRVGSIPAGGVLIDRFRFSYGPCGEPMTGMEDEIRVYVDSGYEIDEESEFNNEKEFTLNCPVRRPDLVIQDVWLGDATVWKEIRPGVYGLVNMPNTVFFRIYNCGCVDQEFNVTLYIDGEVVETKRVSIPARGTIEDHFDFSYGLSEEPCTGREDEIKVSVDEPPFTYFGGILESNEDNNEMTIVKECPPRPDLVIGRIWLDNGGVKYEIKNVGDAEAPQSETLLSIRGGYGEQAVTYEAYDRVEPLDAGESRIEMFENFQFFCDPTVGTYDVYVEADEPDDVVEVNENNNFNTSTFLCWKHMDISVVDAEPVQVVYGAPLIKGKGTAFRVIVDSTSDVDLDVEFELELPQNEWEIPIPDNYPSSWIVRIPANADNFEVMLPYIPIGSETIGIHSLSEGLISGTIVPLPSGSGPVIAGPLTVTYRNVPRPIADKVSFTIRVDPENRLIETDEENNEITKSNIEVKTTKQFKIMYFIHVPNSDYIDPTSGDILCGIQRQFSECRCKYCQNLTISEVWQNTFDIAKRSTEYLLGVSPIADTKMQYAIMFNVSVQSDYGGNNDYWREISKVAGTYGYDYVISIDPCDGCGVSNSGDGMYVCNIGGAPGSEPPTAAHELLSHEILGFSKECYGCIPYRNGSRTVDQCPRCDVDCDSCVASDGFWVNKWKAYKGGHWEEVEENGEKDWKIVGAKYYAGSVASEDITWQRLSNLWKWSDGSLPGGYLDLIDKFEDKNDPLVLFVSGKVYKNGSAEFDSYFEVAEGSVNIEPNAIGDYYIVLVDSEEKVIDKYGFTTNFELLTHEGVKYINQSSFVYRVPWNDKIKRIELQDKNGNVLASKTVSPNKPEIWIISPKNGDVFRENETILVKWDANDVDGDTLVFSLGLSKDKENWVPLAWNLKDKEYVLRTNSLSKGHYWLKVRVTDGINTAEAISGEFFIGIPEGKIEKEITPTTPTPGFEAFLAILALLSAITYLIMRCTR